MNRYQPTTPRLAFAMVALALTAATIGLAGVAPAAFDSGYRQDVRVLASSTVFVVPSTSWMTVLSALVMAIAAPSALLIVAPFKAIRTFPSVFTVTPAVVLPDKMYVPASVIASALSLSVTLVVGKLSQSISSSPLSRSSELLVALTDDTVSFTACWL